MVKRSLLLLATLAACSSAATEDEPTYRSDVTPVTRVEDARPRVFIPPYVDCRGGVCTPVSIAGCTQPGKYFPEQASCEVVRTQRPYWPADPAGTTKPDDPRLKDEAFLRELAWVTEQARATGCTCCHDSKLAPKGPSQWAIDAQPIWTDTVSNGGVALFSGLADSSVLGAFHPEANNGFQRTETGLPSSDGARMRAFWIAELERRGISQEEARKVPPFGGSIYSNMVKKPGRCEKGEGVDAANRVSWDPSSPARYVYVLAEGSMNPGVPPNLDLPQGTIWRLDVLASADPIPSGVRYGTTPKGSFQAFPDRVRAPALERGKTYHLFVLKDVAAPITSCLFTY